MMYTPEKTTPGQTSKMATRLQEQITQTQQDIEAALKNIAALEQQIADLEQFQHAIIPALEQLSLILDPDQRQQLLTSLGLVTA